MKHILTATVLTAVLAGPAIADSMSQRFLSNGETMDLLGSELIGARVYVAEQKFDDDYKYQSGAETDWDDIGEINNIVLSREGDVRGIVIGVGGFLGIGEKDVAVNMDEIRFVSDGEDADDYFVVFTSAKEELENAPEWERAETDDHASARGAVDAVLSDLKRDGYMMVETDVVKAEELIGARVYGVKDEDVGEVGDLIIQSGEAEAAVIDVGGFLGLGEKKVALPIEQVRIMREKDGDDLRVYINASQDRLEAMSEHKD